MGIAEPGCIPTCSIPARSIGQSCRNRSCLGKNVSGISPSGNVWHTHDSHRLQAFSDGSSHDEFRYCSPRFELVRAVSRRSGIAGASFVVVRPLDDHQPYSRCRQRCGSARIGLRPIHGQLRRACAASDSRGAIPLREPQLASRKDYGCEAQLWMSDAETSGVQCAAATRRTEVLCTRRAWRAGDGNSSRQGAARR